MTDFVGTAGDDTFIGTALDDTFDLTQGGNDIARGRRGDDSFYLGSALNKGDRIDGGSGLDSLYLDGDYSTKLVLGAKTVVDIDYWFLAAGHSYNIKVNDATNQGPFVHINGSSLGEDDVLIFDASAETGNAYDILGGAGDDVLIGGSAGIVCDLSQGGNDTVRGGAAGNSFTVGGALTRDDRLDGGSGQDRLYMNGDYTAGLTFGPKTIQNIETIYLYSGFSYKLTLNDANVAAGRVLTIDGLVYGSPASVKIDGSAETDGAFVMAGGNGKDRLIGGAGDDVLSGHGGGDTLIGNAGNDTLAGGGGHNYLDGGAGDDTITDGTNDSVISGGAGHDHLSGGQGHDSFVFADGDSPLGHPDLIADLEDADTIDLQAIDADITVAGDQAFTIESSFTGHAGQLVRSYNAGPGVTSFLMDTDGDSVADIIILAKGDHAAFSDFIL